MRLGVFGIRKFPVFSLIAFNASQCRYASTIASTTDLYKRLNVSYDATPAEIKTAYRKLALVWHPDVVEDAKKSHAEVQFRAVSEAYEVLSDPKSRRKHDDALGVKTSRKMSKTSPSQKDTANAAAGATKKYTDDSSFGLGKAQEKGKRRWKKSNFVRKDANRVFSQAFDGRSLDEILFNVERRRREAKRTVAQDPTNTGNSSPSGSQSVGREETLRRVMEEASVAFGERAVKQYGHSVLKHVRVVKRPAGPQPPPGRHMNFRPFVNSKVPEGVTFVEDPKMGPTCNVNETDKVEEVSLKEENWDVDPVPVDVLEDGTKLSRNHTLGRLSRTVNGAAHNMGQLYSYHRPY